MLQSLLAEVIILEYGYEIGLNWLGKFAQAIIEGVGIIGLGIIVFTIVLKGITLPFDIYQRISMRKQNLVMKEMQPELEKLQKQYANDKTTYNQKMTELYKKNGYSMLGACLPMIFSLVILIVAFQGFRTYSQYANLAMYERMSQAYSEEILKYAPETKDFGDGRTYFILAGEGEEQDITKGIIVWTDEQTEFEIQGADVDSSLAHITYQFTVKQDGLKYVKVVSSREDQFLTCEYKIKEGKAADVQYFVEVDKFETYFEEHKGEIFDEQTLDEDGNPLTKEDIYQEIYKAASEDPDVTDVNDTVAARYIQRIGATAAANWYRDGNDASFLWVKNVWYPDVSYQNPIQSYSNFTKQITKQNITLNDGTKTTLSTVFKEPHYNALTDQLITEKSQPNGYFILIILSIGFMVLSQFISMRSNKESNKYQTVDGQGAKTQKMMMFIMPLMYAVFAFMYSAAFSIYMVMSSVISLLITLLSNLIIGRIFKKKEEAKATASVTRKYAWQMTDKEKRAMEKEAKKEAKQKERASRFKNFK